MFVHAFSVCYSIYPHSLLQVLKISDGQLTVHSPTPSQPSAATNSTPKEEELATAVVCETEEPRENEEKMEVDTKPEGCAKFVSVPTW